MIEAVLAAGAAVFGAIMYALRERSRRRSAEKRADQAEANMRVRDDVDEAVRSAGDTDPRKWLRKYTERRRDGS